MVEFYRKKKIVMTHDILLVTSNLLRALCFTQE